MYDELTRPQCQSSLWKHERQKHCLPCPSQENMSFTLYFNPATNLNYEDGRTVVADPRRHLRQALVVRGGGVQEAPVLSVLQQKVRVDEQDAGELMC